MSFRCSVASSQERNDLANNFSCGGKCDKKLGCGNHSCPDPCHDGPCKPCTVTENVSCYCGKEEREVACGEGIPKGSEVGVGSEARHWIGRFACEHACDRYAVSKLRSHHSLMVFDGSECMTAAFTTARNHATRRRLPRTFALAPPFLSLTARAQSMNLRLRPHPHSLLAPSSSEPLAPILSRHASRLA